MYIADSSQQVVRLMHGFGVADVTLDSTARHFLKRPQAFRRVCFARQTLRSDAMVKRKRDALPEVVHMQPVEDADGTTVGPFAVYFPSGFVPTSDASCTWHVYTHKTHKHQHIIVARTVSFAGRSPCTEL